MKKDNNLRFRRQFLVTYEPLNTFANWQHIKYKDEVHDLIYSQIFYNQYWLQKKSKSYEQFLISIFHELVHHLEKSAEYVHTGRTDVFFSLEETEDEKKITPLVNTYRKKHRRNKKI